MMLNENEKNGAASQDVADTQVVADCLAKGKPVPPEIAHRIQERSTQARKALLAAKGVQDIGVQIIREIRGDLPES